MSQEKPNELNKIPQTSTDAPVKTHVQSLLRLQ